MKFGKISGDAVQKYQIKVRAAMPSSVERASDAANITEKHETLNTLHIIYSNRLQKEGTKRKPEKQHHFSNSLLNIKLSKFKDHGPATDNYSFQGDFEKCCLKFMPTVMLADLLKNYFLEDPALLLVRSVADKQDIWSKRCIWKRKNNAYKEASRSEQF